MADVISLASGLVTLAAFALQSSTALHETVKSFHSPPKPVHDLINELEDLIVVLGQLTGTINATSEPELSVLDHPLLRCGDTCKEFELGIIKYFSQPGVSPLNFRDWATLRYNGDDIDGFTRLLYGYRQTINVAVTGVIIFKSLHTVDPETLENYQNLIETTRVDLEAHLESIDTKLELIQARQAVAGSDWDTLELQPIEEERLSTEKSLQLSTLSSDHHRTSASDNVLKVPTKITKRLSDWSPDENDIRSSDNDNESDNESIFTRFSNVSSATSFSETANARMEVAHFLLDNKELRHLFEIALEKEKFDMKKIKRKMKSLISSYGANLIPEASNTPQRIIANFVHNSAMQVTEYMTQVIMQKMEVEQLSKGNQVNIMLESLKSGQRSSPRKMARINDQDSLDNQFPLRILENAKEFMVSAKAFGILVDDIKLWLGIEIENDHSEVESLVPMAEDVDSEPISQFTESRTMSDQSNTGIQSQITITVESLISEIVDILQKMLWPQPAKGFKRVTWRSALGRTLYIDVKERFDGAAEILQNRFRLSAIKTIAGFPVRVSDHSINRMLTVSSTTQRSPLEPTQSRPPIHTEREPIQLRNLLLFTSSTTHVREGTDRRYLLLCFSTSHSEVFQQIDVTDMTNDQYLFESIHKTYCKVREEECWYSKLFFLRQLSTSPWFKWFTGFHLYAPKQINFVSFNLMPLRQIPAPINIKTPSLPPESEVREKKNWHYEPCPREIEEYSISAACVLQLLEPGHAFLDNAWLDLFPKKLRGELLYESGKTTVAWGMNIVEGINVAVVAWLGLLILITSGLLGALYSAIARDTGGGFALAAWFGSCLSLSILYLQFRI